MMKVRELLKAVLSIEGYIVHSYQSSEQAWESLAQHHVTPDVIVLDMMMPHMDGAGFRARQLQDSSLAHIPVVLLSAMPKDKLEAHRVTVNAVVQKPFLLEDLLTLLARYCTRE